MLLTDGLAEAPAAGGEPLGYGALGKLLAAAAAPAPVGPLQWIDALLDRLRAATRPGLEDDWTALLLERTVAGGAAGVEIPPSAPTYP